MGDNFEDTNSKSREVAGRITAFETSAPDGLVHENALLRQRLAVAFRELKAAEWRLACVQQTPRYEQERIKALEDVMAQGHTACQRLKTNYEAQMQMLVANIQHRDQYIGRLLGQLEAERRHRCFLQMYGNCQDVPPFNSSASSTPNDLDDIQDLFTTDLQSHTVTTTEENVPTYKKCAFGDLDEERPVIGDCGCTESHPCGTWHADVDSGDEANNSMASSNTCSLARSIPVKTALEADCTPFSCSAPDFDALLSNSMNARAPQHPAASMGLRKNSRHDRRP